ncbi:MAG TPA: hypothetical protein VGG13_01515 [Candidatus Saccharimonadales bacterium]
MAVESHLAYGDEPESPRSGSGFEPTEGREKRFGEHELAHTVIWKRDRNEPLPEQSKRAAKTEAAAPKDASEVAATSKPQAPAKAELKPEAAQLKIDHKADRRPAPTPKNVEKPAVKTSQSEQHPADARAEHSNAGEQLQHIAEQTAERAAELADRHHTSPEQPQETAVPKTASEALTPENRSKEQANNAGERQMRAPELFKLSQSIRVEGVSVAEMFAARRIDEEGLRRIVTEFLRGRNVEKIITEEVVRLQLKFELDPQLRRKRNLIGSVAAGKAAGHIKEQTKKLADPKRTKRRAARLSAFARGSLHEAREIVDENPQAAKMVGGIAVALIYATILVLLITR